MHGANRLVLAHWWVAFAAFAGAVVLGAWQMYARSPLHAWLTDAELYYRSVTAHGTTLGYVFPTLVAMGLGYAVCATALDRPIRGTGWAWAGFWLLIVGALMANVSVASGHASVLYTFYPPLTGSPFYYLGVTLVVVGSWLWIGVMVLWTLADPTWDTNREEYWWAVTNPDGTARPAYTSVLTARRSGLLP